MIRNTTTLISCSWKSVALDSLPFHSLEPNSLQIWAWFNTEDIFPRNWQRKYISGNSNCSAAIFFNLLISNNDYLKFPATSCQLPSATFISFQSPCCFPQLPWRDVSLGRGMIYRTKSLAFFFRLLRGSISVCNPCIVATCVVGQGLWKSGESTAFKWNS